MEQPNKNDPNSLEAPDTSVTPASTQTVEDNLEGHEPVKTAGGSAKKPNKLKALFKRFNVYFLMFVLLIIVAITIAVILALNARDTGNATVIDSQTLSDDSLKQLANSDIGVGDPKQLLTVQSNAIFTGKMLVRQNVEIGGGLTVGGDMNISALNVSGKGTFDQLQANDLTLTRNATIQGQLAVQNSVTVNGSGTFSGAVTAPTINTSNLQLNGDFTTARHIVVTGSTPSKSDGNALGGGGTSSISGSDTAGSVTVNTGSNPGTGCFANITFANRFTAVPKVLVTPIGSAAGSVDYYVNRSATGFSICTSSPAASGQSFGFDFFVIG